MVIFPRCGDRAGEESWAFASSLGAWVAWASHTGRVHVNAQKVHRVEYSAVLCFLPSLFNWFGQQCQHLITLERTWCLEREGSEECSAGSVFWGWDAGPSLPRFLGVRLIGQGGCTSSGRA